MEHINDPNEKPTIGVAGYTPLQVDAINIANEGKAIEERYMRWLDVLAAHPDTDKRAVAEARTCIQTGAMWSIRSIFKPQRIEGDV